MLNLDSADLELLDESLAALKSVVGEALAPAGARTPESRKARPRFFCPIPSSVNMFVEAADLHAYEWAHRWGLVSSAGDQSSRFRAARFSGLAARSYSIASEEQLTLVTDWITFLFCYDDMCDTAAGGGGEHQRGGDDVQCGARSHAGGGIVAVWRDRSCGRSLQRGAGGLLCAAERLYRIGPTRRCRALAGQWESDLLRNIPGLGVSPA